MDYETVRFVSWSGFRVAIVLVMHYLLATMDLFYGCLILILVALPIAVVYYHVPLPPKSSVEKIFAKLDRISVGAHRAACLDAPENSLAALYKCQERGCTFVEFDLSFTADDQAVVFHDSSVDRISDGTGAVSALTWAELKQLDINAKHPRKSEFPVTRVSLLSEMVEECLRLDMLFIIDVKAPDARAAPAVLALFEKFPKMYEMAMVSSFYANVIYEIRRRDPQVVACMAWRPHFCAYGDYSPQEGPTQRRYSNPLKHIAACGLDIIFTSTIISLLPYICGLSVLLLHKDSVTPSSVRRCHELGMRVVAWTVNAPVQKQYLAEYLKVPYLTDTLVDDRNLPPKKDE